MNYRIAIVGTRDTVGGFALLGADVVPAESQDIAVSQLERLKKETVTDDRGIERPKYAVVFVMEDLLTDLPVDTQKKLERGTLPAIIPLPTHKGSTGFGLSRLKRIVERAVGSDILQ